MTQLDLSERLFRPTPEDPQLAQLLAFLDQRGWITSAQLHSALRFSDRTCRALAEASEGQIISGQKGYKLTRQSTPEEIREATAWLESQARKMSQRAGAIRRTWHAAPHA